MAEEKTPLKWKFKIEGDFRSSPAVSEGVVYIGSNDRQVPSTYHLYAIDAKTGKEKWKFETEGSVESSPIVSEGVVYFNVLLHLYALDAKTGEEKWKFKSDEKVYPPKVSKGVVYFGSIDYYLYALDAKTGKEKWKKDILKKYHESQRYYDPQKLIVSEGIVYFEILLHLYALDIETGEEKWKFESRGINGTPKLSDGGIYFTKNMGDKLYALDIETGEEKWKFEIGEGFGEDITTSEGVVYLQRKQYDLKKNLYAIDVVDGKEKWRLDINNSRLNFIDEDLLFFPPAASDGVVYYGSGGTYDGKFEKCLYAVDIETFLKMEEEVTIDGKEGVIPVPDIGEEVRAEEPEMEEWGVIEINKWGIVRDKKVEDYYWDCLSDYIDETIQGLVDDSDGDFEEFQTELENYLGVITVVLIDKSDLNNKSFDSNREYTESLKDVLSKEKIDRILKIINTPREFSSLEDVPEDEIAVLLFTDDWNFITYYGLHKEDTPDEDKFAT